MQEQKMRIFHKHFTLIGKLPEYLEFENKKTGEITRVPSYPRTSKDIEYDAKDLIKAHIEDSGKIDAYVYTASHDETNRAFACVMQQECVLLGQKLED